jgi:preprotein translocase SecE subunit
VYTILRGLKPVGLFYLTDDTYMTSPFTYLKHVRDEFAHIVWPTPRTALGHTLVVIAIAIFIALFVALVDYAFRTIVSLVAGA